MPSYVGVPKPGGGPLVTPPPFAVVFPLPPLELVAPLLFEPPTLELPPEPLFELP